MSKSSISDVAQELNVSLRTLRFYEDRGFVTPERRGAGPRKSRWYTPEQVNTLRDLLRYKSFGFTMVEAHALCSASPEEQRRKLDQRETELFNEIQQLQRSLTQLRTNIAQRETHL